MPEIKLLYRNVNGLPVHTLKVKRKFMFIPYWRTIIQTDSYNELDEAYRVFLNQYNVI